MFIFEREGQEREGDTIQSRLQAPSCQHRVWHGARAHKLWDHDLSWSWCLTNWATQVPHNFFFFLMFIYFWRRERQSVSRGGSEREGDTESEAGSRLWDVSTEPHTWLELMNPEVMTWADVRHLTDWAFQPPQCLIFQRFSQNVFFFKLQTSVLYFSSIYPK